MNGLKINIRLFVVVCLLVAAAAWTGVHRLDIDTDVVRSLPTDDRVISDALAVFANHPVHDRIAIDLWINRDDPDLLVRCAVFLEKQMEKSGLFAQVGMGEIADLVPELALHAATNLPLLLGEQDLARLEPRLASGAVRQRLEKALARLGSLEGIGQARLQGLDPLGFSEPVMARMAALIPTRNARLYRGHLLSADGRHLLVSGRPEAPGTNTASARDIFRLLAQVSIDLNRQYASSGLQVRLTPVGAFRAALDNERIIRRDVRLALLLATVGIGLLLLVSFPRPLLGLLSLVPAIAGTAMALFTFSLFHETISIMVLGFGGAIISITVDQGIAYMLFLDRPRQTRGRQAAHEVRAVGIMAVITTIGAFLILAGSGFPVFSQLGRFAALGVLFSALFVHLVFPRLFPVMPAADNRRLPLHRLVDRLYSFGRTGMFVGIGMAVFFLFFAVPRFQIDLDSMNTVSRETMEADQLFTRVWGGIGNQVLLMETARTMDQLQEQNDRVMAMVEQDLRRGVLAGGFVPSMLFPGTREAAANLAAWKSFWTGDRVNELGKALQTAGLELGFAPDAFAEFLHAVTSPDVRGVALPEKYFSLLGISRQEQGGKLVGFVSLVPGENYRAEEFFKRYQGLGSLFDGPWFSRHLANILYTTFTRMFLILGAGLAVLLLLFYLDIRLTLITWTPVLFAWVCTLGTLRLLHHPLDIPALMLSVIILGMGVDYAIFCVRAHQRYRDISHPSYTLVRCAVFLAGASTLIGFGVLCFADHSLLRSIGLVSFAGIGYSLLGTFLLLPPLLESYFSRQAVTAADGKKSIRQRVRLRYRLLETYPRMFARFKLKLDPMFTDLPVLLKRLHLTGRMQPEGQDQVSAKEIGSIVDIGCGYGVPACWFLEYFPHSRVYGVDPDGERVRVASLAAADRGFFIQGLAQDLARAPAVRPADLVLLLDMLHYLDDARVMDVFIDVHRMCAPGATLLARYVIRPDKPSFSWYFEDFRARSTGGGTWYRSREAMAELLERAGFAVEINELTPADRQLVWLAARAVEKSAGQGSA